MVIGDKVRVIKKVANGLDIGEEATIITVDFNGVPKYNNIKVKTDDGYEWWLLEGEFELLNQEL